MSLNLQYEPEVVVDITGLSNEDWLEYRKSGIGGSDAGIILGVSSYKLPRDVYFEKIGRTPDMQRMKIGSLLRLESVWRIWLQKSLQKRQDFVSGRKKGCCVIHYIPI